VSPKHQITIPVDVLRETGLRVGDKLEVTAEGVGRVRIRRVEDPIAVFAGRLAGAWPPDEIDRLRSEWR
jgi:bifunctional DNA-binding transcriptional regulator/antitoxin component of YhaV-PrlF toxin-antitoxin module